MSSTRVSKSRYVAGLQCHKLLWLKTHEPGAPELVADASLEARFETGHRVGELARACFSEGVLIELDPKAPDAAVQATRAALDAGTNVLFEASFASDGAFAAVDILEKVDGGWTLIEVKATLSAKPQHLSDLAIQVYLARCAGLRVDRVQVMHLNGQHRHPDVEPLFSRSDVTDKVNELVPPVAGEVAKQLRVIEAPCPEFAIGEHCDEPYECAFKSRCWPERAMHDIGELCASWRTVAQLRARGYENIRDIPETEPLVPSAARQRRAVITGEPVVEPGLRERLAVLTEPLAFLDFETIGPALPVWRGCRPYRSVPVQHSVHVRDGAGVIHHHAFLAEPGSDPREALARHLLASTREARTVLSWNARFERQCIQELAVALPQLAPALYELDARVDDLLLIVREYVYHPEFRGSLSLKSVGPALVPELGYAELEVAEGGTASTLLARYLLDPETLAADEQQRLRAALLAYCERDTLLLVRIYEYLQRLVRR